MEQYKTTCEAVTFRIKELLSEHNISLYKLAQNSGVLYNTLKKIVSNTNKSVDLAIVIQIAGGFDMTLAEFADHPIFHEDNLKF